jgi:hypothetical protein
MSRSEWKGVGCVLIEGMPGKINHRIFLMEMSFDMLQRAVGIKPGSEQSPELFATMFCWINLRKQKVKKQGH